MATEFTGNLKDRRHLRACHGHEPAAAFQKKRNRPLAGLTSGGFSG